MQDFFTANNFSGTSSISNYLGTGAQSSSDLRDHPAYIPNIGKRITNDISFSPAQQARMTMLEAENRELQNQVDAIKKLNDEMIVHLDSIYASPGQKRALLTKLEEQHRISRRRACKLLKLARSTSAYITSSSKRVSETKDSLFSTLSLESLVQRLLMLSKQMEAGTLTLDPFTLALVEHALVRLGLHTAANLSKQNMQKAMEMFHAYMADMGI
jgi:hypothetical protein